MVLVRVFGEGMVMCALKMERRVLKPALSSPWRDDLPLKKTKSLVSILYLAKVP